MADRLLVAVGERAVSDEVMSTTVRARQAAFTIFVRAYDEVRRGIVYLRWNMGDADEIAPSLYANRVKRRKGEDKVEEPKSDETLASATPAAGTPKPTFVAGAPNPNAPVGHPDSSPFLTDA